MSADKKRRFVDDGRPSGLSNTNKKGAKKTMFSIPQMVLVILWFTFYNLLTSGTGLGLVAGGVVLNGLVVGAIMGDISTGFYLAVPMS